MNRDDVWVAVYDCNKGYSLSGNRHRYCQENGRWTGSDPHCSPGVSSMCTATHYIMYMFELRIWVSIHTVYASTFVGLN